MTDCINFIIVWSRVEWEGPGSVWAARLWGVCVRMVGYTVNKLYLTNLTNV